MPLSLCTFITLLYLPHLFHFLCSKFHVLEPKSCKLQAPLTTNRHLNKKGNATTILFRLIKNTEEGNSVTFSIDVRTILDSANRVEGDQHLVQNELFRSKMSYLGCIYTDSHLKEPVKIKRIICNCNANRNYDTSC